MELAKTKPAEQITVSEPTSAAGVACIAFYRHGESPTSFLAEYLIEQLHPKLSPLVDLLKDPRPDYLDRWIEIQLSLLEHIQDNREIYAHVFAPDGQSVVLSLLTAYFERIFGEYVQEFSENIEGPEFTDLRKNMAISQQVHNTVAMISSWLRTGLSESPERVLETYASLVPPWQLARFTGSGVTNMRRSRRVAGIFANRQRAVLSTGPGEY